MLTMAGPGVPVLGCNIPWAPAGPILTLGLEPDALTLSEHPRSRTLETAVDTLPRSGAGCHSRSQVGECGGIWGKCGHHHR